ncbi:hypothetical protein AB4865_09830 [Capnocytophaga sp. ARDL2]|uniref:hypothetical protein n=1 Tax=Capnocytophaga sp. ARDL2 TaxID=3238809 RepID=UPI003558BC8A
MKNFWTLFFLCICTIANAQFDEEELEVIYIDKLSRSQIEQVITNVRNKTYKNYVNNTHDYEVTHKAVLNDTLTLVDSKELYEVAIFFANKKINKSIKSHPNNKNEINRAFFERYSFNDSPMYWLTEFVIRKYVNVPDLDFLNNFGEYQFQRSYEKDLVRIDFYSDDMYEGYFTFDKNYNLKEVSFYLLHPYPIDHSQTKNGKKMFTKNWKYTKEKVSILFELNTQNKLVIKEMKAEEQITDYNFQRFNAKRELLLEDKNLNFKTELLFKAKR